MLLETSKGSGALDAYELPSVMLNATLPEGRCVVFQYVSHINKSSFAVKCSQFNYQVRYGWSECGETSAGVALPKTNGPSNGK